MAIEGNFYPYFGHVNQNMPLPHSNSNLKYNTLQPVEFDQQKDEVDHFLRSQNERLRIFVQLERKQQAEALLKKVELDVFYMIRQKDEQIAEAVKRRLELEDFLTRVEIENESWRRAAHESEAMVLSLQNSLQQMKERASYCYNNDAAESCCDIKNHEEETWENRVCGGDEQINMICKCCGSRESSFMFLPCRHLCSCKACEPSLQACPVCLMPKRSIIETLIF